MESMTQERRDGIKAYLALQRANRELREQRDILHLALKRSVPWLGKLIADGGHLESVAFCDAVGALQQAEAAIAQTQPGKPEAEKPKFYECGICGSWHNVNWNGDCRMDSARWDTDQLNETYGAMGWEAVAMPGGEEG
jgi:hypothetical protein